MRQDGFTLLESLVALVVFGLLLVGLSQGTNFGLQAWDRQARTIDARGQLDATDRMLRRLIARMDPDTDVAGEAHALAFGSELPANAIADDPEDDVVLRVDTDHRLVLRWRRHLHVARFGPPPAPVVTGLLEGVTQVDFAYWPRDGAGGWRESWRGGPPGLVRIRLVFPAGDRRRWPDIVVAPVRDRTDG